MKKYAVNYTVDFSKDQTEKMIIVEAYGPAEAKWSARGKVSEMISIKKVSQI